MKRFALVTRIPIKARNNTNNIAKLAPSLSSHISTYTKDNTINDPQVIITNKVDEIKLLVIAYEIRLLFPKSNQIANSVIDVNSSDQFENKSQIAKLILISRLVNIIRNAPW